MIPDVSMPCATCGNQSTISCEACSCVQYCSQACQNQNLHEHRQRRGGLLENLMERIAETLQLVFYVFPECAYDLPISSIGKGPDVVMISEGPRDLQTTCQPLFLFPT
jgi:hypothetical protein